MSKYGPGVSMKTVITEEVRSVQEILDKSNLSNEEKKAVIDSVKEMAYQWCQANAGACAIEEAAEKILTPVKWQEITLAAMTGSMSAIKMAETYPF